MSRSTVSLLASILLATCFFPKSTFAQCPSDDAVTTNQACHLAVPGSLGTTTGLSVQFGVEDWWSYPVPDGHRVTLDVLFVDDDGNIDLTLFGGPCPPPIARSTSVTDNERVTWVNRTGGTAVVTLQVRLGVPQTPVSSSCNDYSIVASFLPDPCSGPTDDAEEENDTVLTAGVPSSDRLEALQLRPDDEDHYLFLLDRGEVLEAELFYSGPAGELDLHLLGNVSGIPNVVAISSGSNDGLGFGRIRYTHDGPTSEPFVLRIFRAPGNPGTECQVYDLHTSIGFAPPCFTGADDHLEENDTCNEAVPLGPGSETGLFVSESDEDHYRYTLSPGEELEIVIEYDHRFGDVDAGLWAPSCGFLAIPVTDASDLGLEYLSYVNESGVVEDVFLEVTIDFSGNLEWCNFYDLTSTITPDACGVMDDAFEQNDDGPSATPLTPGTYTDLLVGSASFLSELDLYRVTVGDSERLTVTARYTASEGGIILKLLDEIPTMTSLDSDASLSDHGQVTYTNRTGAARDVLISVVKPFQEGLGCSSYDLIVDLSPPTLLPFCFGEGFRSTPCPCGNDSPAGHLGGCAHQDGDGARLAATGSPSVSLDTLHFGLSGSTRSSFGLLVSGDNVLTQTISCIGCGIQAFDGLRCAGGNLLRHGTRATNLQGDAVQGWGPPSGPPGGLISASGFTAGQVRHFFAFFRTDPAQTCGTGQNSSNGIQVTFQP